MAGLNMQVLQETYTNTGGDSPHKFLSQNLKQTFKELQKSTIQKLSTGLPSNFIKLLIM
jgi:hypothetical protein